MDENKRTNHDKTELSKREIIFDKLRKNGCRITKQRKKLIDVILENDCSSCKEIYYYASKFNSKIGIATVYRMIKTMEDIGAINRRNQYKVFLEDVQNSEND